MKCRDMVQLKITALHSQIVNFASKSSHVNVITHFSFIINRRYIVQSGGVVHVFCRRILGECKRGLFF